MQKKQLKVGEEYAVFLTPGAVRRFNGRYSYGSEPMRVTLLEIDATEWQWERGNYSSAYAYRQLKGHKVSIPTNPGEREHHARATVVISIYENAVPGAAKHGLKLRPKENERGTRQAEWTRDFLLLESAGCFLSTWADWEARKTATAKAKDDAAERELQKRLAHDAAAPAIEAKLEDVLNALRARGTVTLKGDYIGHEDRHIEVKLGIGYTFSGEKHYRSSEAEREVLGGASFKLSLDALAELLGV